MNILLHSPLHPSLWIYLIRNLPGHNWFVEPDLNFQEGKIPFQDLNLKAISKVSQKKFDVQIISTHLGDSRIQRILRTFKSPIIWLEYWNTKHPLHPKITYPLVCTNRSNFRIYPDVRFTYVGPSKDLWNKPWIGDKKEIFCPARYFYAVPKIRKILNYLEKRLPLKVMKKGKRQLSFSKWQEYFIHSRALLDMTTKFSSTVLFEAMTIGMPVVTLNVHDYRLMIENNIDGFRSNSKEELFNFLTQLLDDYSFAKKMGRNAQKKAEIVFDIKKQQRFWNQAFQDAIEIHTKRNLEIEKGKKKR